MSLSVALLRGINVSGKNLISMKDLEGLFLSAGMKNVTTYIQSGNVIFKTDKKFTNVKLAKLIEDKIAATCNFQVPVIIRTLKELQHIVAINPFIKEDIDSLYVTFLSNSPNAVNLEKLDNVSFLPDRFEIRDKEIFLSVSSYGSTKLSNNFFENKLKVTATTRNWKTVIKLLELANE